jgi:hypothetical protein
MKTHEPFSPLDLADLERVSGGMRWQDMPMSQNVEDRRPQWDGGPVPNDEWAAEQHGYDTSCWYGADGNQYSGNADGGEPEVMPDYDFDFGE